MAILTSKQKIVVICLALAAVITVIVKYISSSNDTISITERHNQSNENTAMQTSTSGSVAEKRNTNTKEMLVRQAAIVSAVVQNLAKNGKKTEEEIAEYLKEHLISEPDNTLHIAKEALKDHPNSEKVPEFHWYVIRSLLEIGQRDEAIDEAKMFVLQYPGNYHAEDVRRHLLTPMAPPQ